MTLYRGGILLLISIFCVVCECQLPRRCIIDNKEKKECGYAGIPKDYCLGRGCCYDNATKGIAWCYKASTNMHLSKTALLLLSRDGVPFEVLAALYADNVPGAEWLMAFKNGKLDTTRLLQIISKKDITIDPYLADIAAGKSPLKRMLRQLASMRGMDPNYLEAILGGNTQAVLKHLVALSHAKRNYTSVPYHVLNSFLSGNKIQGNYMVYHYLDVLFTRQNIHNPFRQAFFRAFAAGETADAIQWAYLFSLSDKFPQESFYPKNTASFAAILEEAKNNPGKILPSTLEAIQNGKLGVGAGPNKQSFGELFGPKAYAYVCSVHSEYLQSACKKLIGKYIVTAKECIDAGCCLRKKSVEVNGKKEIRQICHENTLGNVGLILANSNEGEQVVKFILNAAKLYRPKFIPWVPNTKLPKTYLNFKGSGSTDIFAHHFPTVIPLEATELRPNFTWKPHGPTAFPFPTRVPEHFLVATDGPFIESFRGIGQEEEPKNVRGRITLGLFKPTCVGVKVDDRYPCMDNFKALGSGGRDLCLNSKCCYEPDWRNFTIPACFRRVTYGQCRGVEPEEREECGHPGISREKCLGNVQCCYDSAVSTQSLYDKVPWCYYKKRAPVKEENRCSRNLAHERRQGCFLNYNFNFVVSQQSCEEVDGCCYEKVQLSWFDRVIGRKVQPPYCYKGHVFDIAPTDPRPPQPKLKLVCQTQNELLPHERTPCSKTAMNWFTCVSAGCCFEASHHVRGAPWCYRKSRVPA